MNVFQSITFLSAKYFEVLIFYQHGINDMYNCQSDCLLISRGPIHNKTDDKCYTTKKLLIIIHFTYYYTKSIICYMAKSQIICNFKNRIVKHEIISFISQNSLLIVYTKWFVVCPHSCHIFSLVSFSFSNCRILNSTTSLRQ